MHKISFNFSENFSFSSTSFLKISKKAAYLNAPVETLISPNRKQAESYPRGPLTTRQTEILKKIYGMDYLIYEVSNQIFDEKVKGN